MGGPEEGHPETVIKELTADELQRWLLHGPAVNLLDVREAEERAICTIAPGLATEFSIPMRELPGRVAELSHQRDGRVVVYCHHGVRSRIVAEWLCSQGFTDVHNLAGGIDAWATSIEPYMSRY